MNNVSLTYPSLRPRKSFLLILTFFSSCLLPSLHALTLLEFVLNCDARGVVNAIIGSRLFANCSKGSGVI